MIQGIINVLKPSGMSSHDIIGQVRRIYGMKRWVIPVRSIPWRQEYFPFFGAGHAAHRILRR